MTRDQDKTRGKTRGWTLLLAAVTLSALAIPCASRAQQGTASYRIGVGATDNVARVPTDQESDTIYTAGLDVDWLDEAGRLHSEIDAQLEYANYASGTFDNEVTGGLNASFELSLVSRRLYWLLRENFGQRQQEPFAALTPNNREYVNFVTTGPVWDIIDSTRNIVRAQLVYSRVDFEESLSDNERFGGALQFGREVHRGHTLSLVASTEAIEFSEDAVGTDFDRSQAYIRYEGVGNSNVIEIDVGYIEVETDGETENATLFRLDWSRQISPYSSWRLLAGTDYSDEGSVFRLFQEDLGNLNVTTNTVTNPNPFLNHYLSANLTYARDRSATSFFLGLNQADFEDGDVIGDDRETVLAGIRFQTDISDRFFLGLRLESRLVDFTEIDRKTDSLTSALTLGYRVGAYTDISLRYQYTRRRDTGGLNEYDENRAFLTMSYTPRWAR